MNFFRSDNKYIYLNSPYCEFYIPMYYFDGIGGFAEDLGQHIRTLGVFDVGFFENGKLKEMHVMNVPTWIDVVVYDSEIRDIRLPGDTSTTQCKVLKFFKDQVVMNSTIIEDSSNAEAYLNFVTKGKIPPIVPYEESIQIWRKNQELNSANLGVPSVILELILSVSYRDKKNPGNKFAHVIGSNLDVSQYDYVMNNIRQICQYTSTFTALTFEDVDAMVTTSLNRTRKHKPEAVSPLEDLIKL